jgi:hypothetical protein
MWTTPPYLAKRVVQKRLADSLRDCLVRKVQEICKQDRDKVLLFQQNASWVFIRLQVTRQAW